MAQHYGENKTIERAKTLGEWRNMEDEIIHFVKKCFIWQLQKTTRIKRQCEAIIPDTPVNLNDKIAMDIFGPLPQTTNRNEYMLSIQDMLTKYLILVHLKSAESETIIEGLYDHYIYIFGSPKNILSDQGQNFVSELIQSFENLFRIKHVTTKNYHPQSNGALERAHSTIKNLLKTSIQVNGTEWDKNLKIISMAHNNIKHDGTGFTPLQLTFGKDAIQELRTLEEVNNQKYPIKLLLENYQHITDISEISIETINKRPVYVVKVPVLEHDDLETIHPIPIRQGNGFIAPYLHMKLS